MSAGNNRLVNKLLAKLNRPTHVATVNKYLKDYDLALDNMMIVEHLTNEWSRATTKTTYTEKKRGIQIFFLNYIDAWSELQKHQKTKYSAKVKCLIKNAPKYERQDNSAKDKDTIDHLYSTWLYCGVLLEGKAEHLTYAFVLQAIYWFGVSVNFLKSWRLRIWNLMRHYLSLSIHDEANYWRC